MKLRSAFLIAGSILLGSALVGHAQVPGVNSTLQAMFNLVYDNSTMKPTFSSSAVYVPGTNATDTCILSGSATKDVRVRRILLSGVASAVQSDPVGIIKRSTANSGGTSSGLTEVAYDSTNALSGAANAATAVALAYTVNPTVGTIAGFIADPYMTWGNLTTGVGAPLIITLGQLGSPVVLRGVAQSLAVNLNGSNYTTPVLSCTFEWTEE